MEAAALAMSVPVPIGDTYIGLGQRGRVVDTVTHHGYPLSGGLQLPHFGDFGVREYSGKNPLNANLARDAVGGAPIVASNHADLDAHPLQTANSGLRFGFYCVGDADGAYGQAIHGNRHCGLPLSGEPLRFGRKGFHESADGHVVAIRAGFDAGPCKRAEAHGIRQRDSQRLGMLDDGPSQGMLGIALRRCCRTQDFNL
jgi:hypothetical protein